MDYSDQIKADTLVMGRGVVLHPSVQICGPSGQPATRVEIGDNCYIGQGVQIRCSEFAIGDYSRVHHQTTIHGYKPCIIGHNAWIGQQCIIDSIGGMFIGNNCGVGAHSQLWSHIKYGDTLAGCRFKSEKPMEIGKDVWFVGHCIVSPIVAADRAMAMAGSVVTRDMQANTIYAGVPASEISSKIGPQFVDVPLGRQIDQLRQYAKDAGVGDAVVIVEQLDDALPYKTSGKSVFIVARRTYLKVQTPEEVAFMQYLLPDRAKFTPEPIGSDESS